jgi:hypothetical protein
VCNTWPTRAVITDPCRPARLPNRWATR